ncbi:hypothetical protein GCM10027060_26170 [Nesterenkonia halophila]|uniref:hypothetical protein n=1 Tax=Nesterenkonia halophila TaxID=302044 RepID=UPI0012918C88|nr:hypothetical protein [Nesterenkonia halophila]
MSEHTTYDPAGDGFTGTLPAFFAWLEEHLVYSKVHIGEPQPDPLYPEEDAPRVRRIELHSGGGPDDDLLISRVNLHSLLSVMYWYSSHRGGVTVYEVPVQEFDSEKERRWLDASTDVVSTLQRARNLLVSSAHDDEFKVALPNGARVRFSELDREGDSEPAGVLTVEAISDEEAASEKV